MENRIINVFENMKIAEVEKVVKEELECNRLPLDVLKECQAGMSLIGKKFESGSFYLSELLMSAKMFEKAMKILEPELQRSHGGGLTKVGKIVLATPEGDIHDLGKNLFAGVAKAANFDIVDLGIDVPAATIVKAVKEEKPDILGLSVLLTTVYPALIKISTMLKDEILDHNFKFIIGGAAVSEQIQRQANADAFTLDANEGLQICKSWIKMEVKK